MSDLTVILRKSNGEEVTSRKVRVSADRDTAADLKWAAMGMLDKLDDIGPGDVIEVRAA